MTRCKTDSTVSGPLFSSSAEGTRRITFTSWRPPYSKSISRFAAILSRQLLDCERSAARIALEPSKRISRVKVAGAQDQNGFQSLSSDDKSSCRSFHDNSRQNFFAHVRDSSHCKKIAIVAIRIMTA